MNRVFTQNVRKPLSSHTLNENVHHHSFLVIFFLLPRPNSNTHPWRPSRLVRAPRPFALMSVAVNCRGCPNTIHTHTPAPTPALCCTAHAAAPSNSESSVVASLVGQLTEQELDMTVGDYIEANLKRQVKELRQHMKQNVAEFDEQSRKARKVLRDIAMQRVASTSNDDLVEEEAAAPVVDDEGALSADLGAHIAQAAAAEAAEEEDAFAMVGLTGVYKGQVLEFRPAAGITTWTVGRDTTNDHSLDNDGEVSGSHAEVVYDKKAKGGPQFKLKDVGSTNGTWATALLTTAAKLKKNKFHPLKVDHLITFGSTTFKWCYHADALELAKDLAPKDQLKKKGKK